MSTIKNHHLTLSTLQIWNDADFAVKLTAVQDHKLNLFDRKCLHEIWQFNEYKGQLKFRSKIREMCGYGTEDLSAYHWDNEKRDLAGRGFYFGSAPYKVNENGVNEPLGIVIQEDLSPDYHNENERPYYYELFPYRFITLANAAPFTIDDFLKFQLANSFDNDEPSFKSFLNKILSTRSDVLGDHKNIIADFLNEELLSKPQLKGNQDVKFDSFLNVEGLRILPFLLRTYTDTKPKNIGLMILALDKLGCLVNQALTNQTELHKSLQVSFGKIGTRAALNSNLNSGNSYNASQVEVVRLKLKKELDSLSTKES